VALAGVTLAVGLLAAGLWYANQRRVEKERIAANVEACADCLSHGLTMDYEFADEPKADVSSKRLSITTVRQKLTKLQAYCQDRVIYDGEGKQVLFIHVIEFGYKPSPEDEARQSKQWQEMEQLEQQGFTVVRMWQKTVPC
jgi:hypothetical protein